MKLVTSLALALLVVSCSPPDSPDDGTLRVVATTTMVADLAREIGGDRVRVAGLMGPAVDPHSYVPKLGDTRLLEQADVIFYNGLHLEGRFQNTLEAMAGRGRKVVAVSAAIPEERLLAPQEDFEGAVDPHIWGDPEIWAHAIDPVVAALSAADPDGGEGYRSRGQAYHAELRQLAEWARAELAQIPPERRVLVTSHDAFFYTGRAFGLEVRGLQGVSSAAEAGLRDRAELVAFLRQRGVRTVFAETSINPKAIAAVAAEAGVALSPAPLFSDALGTPGDTFPHDGRTHDRGTYTGMLRHNVLAIVEGLQ
jgi:manganese/zinc/iron transport system substrate-binding protein